MNTKRTLRHAAAAVVLTWCSLGHTTGIPVVDAAQLVQWASQLKQLMEQYKMLNAQWNTAKTTLQSVNNTVASINGYRSAGRALLTTPVIAQQLPPQAINIVNGILQGGRSGADTVTRAMYDSITKVPCKGTNQALVAACQANGLLTISLNNSISDSLQKSQQRVAKLAKLTLEIDKTTDIKDAQDLSARIQSEMTQLQADKAMVDFTIQLQEQQIKIAQMRSFELDREIALKKSTKCLTCIN